MPRKLKCPSCSRLNDKENTKQIGNRHYCVTCAEDKEKSSQHNKDGWDDLYKCICEIYNIKTLTGMMFKQVSDFRKEPYNYTNTGMCLTLKYFYNILENEVLEDSGVGIIPYFYEKAKQHFIERMDIEEYMDHFEYQEETKIVKINPFQEKYKKYKLLSFDNIIREGGVDVETD